MRYFGYHASCCMTLIVLLAAIGYSQGSVINSNIASQYFQEATKLCSTDKGKLWRVSLWDRCCLWIHRRAPVRSEPDRSRR